MCIQRRAVYISADVPNAEGVRPDPGSIAVSAGPVIRNDKPVMAVLHSELCNRFRAGLLGMTAACAKVPERLLLQWARTGDCPLQDDEIERLFAYVSERIAVASRRHDCRLDTSCLLRDEHSGPCQLRA